MSKLEKLLIPILPFMGDEGDGGGDGDPKLVDVDFGDGVTVKMTDAQAKAYKSNLDRVAGASRKDAEAKRKKDIQDLIDQHSGSKTELETLKAKLQELEEAGLSDVEKYKKQQERLKLEHEKVTGDLTKSRDTLQSKLHNTLIENAIHKSLSGKDLSNQAQTMLLLKQLGDAKVVTDEDGNDRVVIDAKNLGIPDDVVEGKFLEGKLSPQEAVDKFLNIPTNAHHLKNNLVPGSGTHKGGTKNDKGVRRFKLSELRVNETLRAEQAKLIKDGTPYEVDREN